MERTTVPVIIEGINRMPLISSLVGSKVAVAALALAALGGGGAVVASAAGALPTPDHSVAMPVPSPTDEAETPDPTGTPDPSESTQGPDLSGPAAFGLCTAYLAGGLPENSVPGQALRTAAGEDGPDAFCQLVVDAIGAARGNAHADEHGAPAAPGSAADEHAGQQEHPSAPDHAGRPDDAGQSTGHAPTEHHGK
ncbi:MAG TPA: hypothetical protein VL294_02835 [Pseudolysinimonas sp.]|nr:hypothetical protein [Pseudolysinimonas sp.]